MGGGGAGNSTVGSASGEGLGVRGGFLRETVTSLQDSAPGP